MLAPGVPWSTRPVSLQARHSGESTEMADQEFENLGLVTNLAFGKDPDNADLYLLKFRSPRTEQTSVQITGGAARILWYYLTDYLFPASTNLTARVSTASVSLPTSLSVVFVVKVEKCPGNIIEVAALSAVHGWILSFDHDVGGELWADLDQTLRTTPGDKKIHLL